MTKSTLTPEDWENLLENARNVLLAVHRHQKSILERKLQSFDQINWTGLRAKIQADMPIELQDISQSQARVNFIVLWLENILCE